MAGRKEFETILIIKGDGKGGVKAVQANKEELEKLNQTQDKGKKKTKEYGDQHKKSEKDVGKFTDTVKTGAATVARWAGAAATAITGLVGINTKLLQETDRTARQMGISTQAFMAQSEMARMAGLDVDAYGDVLRDTSVRVQEFASIGTGEAQDFFRKMNLDVQDFRDLAPDELIAAIGREMQDLNRNERIMFLDQLGSDNATALVDVITRLDEMEEQAIAVGAALSDVDAAQVTMAAEGMDKVGMVMRGAGNQITAEFAPIVSDLSERFFNAAVEAGGIGGAVEETVTVSVHAISYLLDVMNGFRTFLKTIETGWVEIGAAGSAALASNAEVSAALVNDVFDNVMEAYSILAKLPGVFSGPAKVAQNVLSNFHDELVGTKVDASEIVELNERMQAQLIESRSELQELLNTPPPSEGIDEWLEQVRVRSEEAAEAQVVAREAQEDLTKSNEDASQKVKDLINQMEFENTLLDKTSLEQKILTNLRKLDSSATDEQRAAVRRLTIERHNAEEAMAAQVEREKEMAQTRQNAIENIQRNLGDMLYNELTESAGDWNDYFDNILKGWARVQTELAANNLVDAIFNGGSWNPADIIGLGGGAETGNPLSLLSGASGLMSMFGGGGAAATAASGTATYGLGAEVLAANGYAAAGSSGFLASAGGFLQAAAPWMIGAFALNALLNKEQTFSGNAGMLLHGLPHSQDRQFEMAPFASGLQPVGFARRASQEDAMDMSDLFRMVDQRAFDILAEAGVPLRTTAATFKGLDEKGLGSGIFFGSAGEEGVPGRPVAEQLEMYLRQALASVADQLDPDDYQAILRASGAEGILQAMEEHLAPAADATADAIRDASGGLVTFEQALTGAQSALEGVTRAERQRLEDLRRVALDHYNEQVQAEEDAFQRRMALAEQLSTAAFNLKLGDTSPLSRRDQFNLVNAEFESMLERVRQGDFGAAEQLPGLASSLADASAGMFASSGKHKDVMARIFAGLDEASSLVAPSAVDYEQTMLTLEQQLVAEMNLVNEQLQTLPNRMANELAPVMGLFITQAKLAGKSDEYIANQVRQMSEPAQAGTEAFSPGYVEGNATPEDEIVAAVKSLKAQGMGIEEVIRTVKPAAQKRGLSAAYIGSLWGYNEAQTEQALLSMGIQPWRKGGIASGPSSGHLQMLHGTEAVIPLPDGKTVPVTLNGRDAGGGDQKMGEVVSLLQNIFQAVATTGSIEENRLTRIANSLDSMERKTNHSGIGSARYGNPA